MIMGYSLDYNGRLCCDRCGIAGGVRKRKCRFTVTYGDGGSLPYCPAPALCGDCFRHLGGTRGIHTDGHCGEGARLSQAREDEKARRIAGGDLPLLAGYGSWHADVPNGSAAGLYGDRRTGEAYWVIFTPASDYTMQPFLSDVREGRTVLPYDLRTQMILETERGA